MTVAGAAGRALCLPPEGETETLSVFGAFSTAVYLSRPGGGVLMLHDERWGEISFGVGIGDAGKVLKRAAIRPESAAVLTRDSLTFSGDLTVVLTPAPARPDPVPVGRLPASALAEAAELGAALLSESGRGGVGALVLPGAAPEQQEDAIILRLAKAAVSGLEAGLRRRRPEAVRAALGGLLGLGKGLTPSLDDYLLGFVKTLLAADAHWGLPLPEAGLLAAELRRLAPERTNRYSAAYLLAAAGGERLSVLDDLLRPETLLSAGAAERLLAVGHSSGGDMLTGVVAGLRYCLGITDKI